MSSCAVGVSWKPNTVDNVSTTLLEYPEAYTLSNNIIEVDIFKAAAGYNRYYTPDTNEVLIQNERVYVERKVGAAWVRDGVVQNVVIIETDTGYNAIRSYDGVHTFYDVVYVLDDGKPLKFEVNLTAKSEGEYRINWDIQGIMGDNKFVDGGSYKFGVSEYNYKVQIDISDVIEGFGEDYIDVVSSNTVPNGRILDFYFGSFNLEVGEGVLVDPSISTTSLTSHVFAIDLDEDGDIDILSVSDSADYVAWHENNGAESFTEHIIADSKDGARSVYAIDMDGDGDIDVLSAELFSDTISWYENNGAESFTTHIVASGVDGAEDVFAIDVDGDGDIDVLSASYNAGASISWYENNGAESFTTHIVALGTARSVYAIDVDGDNDIDILGAFSGANKIEWYENDGTESFTTHIVDSSAPNAYDVFAIDVDGDNDIDVLGVTSGYVRWYENNGAESFTTHNISSLDTGQSVYAIDIDGDNDIDVLSGSFYTSDGKNVRWYENDGAESFTAHDFGVFINSAYDVFAIDVDGDNDVDVLSSAYNYGLRWYEQTKVDIRTLDLNNIAITGVVVENQYDDGGFPDVNGYTYFDKWDDVSTIYTVSITGSEQDSGMKVQTNTDIDSVSSIKVQFKTLDSSKSYNIYLDNVYKETAYRSGTHDYTYTESGLQTVKLQETKENIQLSLTNLSSSVINASGVTVADAASQNLISGAATFEPYKYESGIYPINITNTSLADGLNFTLTASGLTAAPTTFNGLDSSKSYHVNYDGGLYANISGVTSYTYNFTSFSTHTVQLVEYTPVADTGEDEEEPTSVASGLIEIGELTIMKEEFDLLTVEQIEALDVSQDTKDQLLRLKTITVNKWKFALGIGFIWLIIEVGKGKKAGFGLVISIALIVFSAYKLGYF